MSGTTEASIDVRHLREAFSEIPKPPPEAPGKTLVPQSPPPAEAPSNDIPLVQASVPSSIPYYTANAQPQSQSRDFSGNLHLSYSIPYSQIDLGETQVDSASMKAINSARYQPLARDTQEREQEEDHEPTATEEDTPRLDTQEQEREPTATKEDAPMPDTQEHEQEPKATEEDVPRSDHELMATAPEEPGGPELDLEPIIDDGLPDEDERVEKSTHFLEANRFDSPGRHQQSSPAKVDINPLGHLIGMSKGTGMSLADVFNTPSSPIDRMRAVGSLPPPTPSYAAARLMAQSMPLAPTFWDNCSSPVRAASPAWRRGTTEPPEFTRPPQTGMGRELAKEASKTPVRPRTLSPVPFSSPAPLARAGPVLRDDSDDEDILFSKDELKKMKVDARKRKAAAAIKAYRPSESKTLSTKQTKKSKKPVRISEKLVERGTSVQRPVIELLDDDETASDTGPESQCREDAVIFSTPAAARPPPVAPQTQVPASPPRARRPPRTQPRTTLDLDETWDQFHQVPIFQRRSKSYSSLRKGQASSSESPLHHTKSMPDISSPPKLEKRGTSTNPMSLTQMVPFNVPDFPPTPPDPDPTDTISEMLKNVPDFVRESSGLIPLTSQVQSSLTPGPSSPARDDTRGTPPPVASGSRGKQNGKTGKGMAATLATVPEGDSVHSITPVSAGLNAPTREIAPNQTLGTPTKRRREADDEGDDLTSSSPGAQCQLKSFAALNNSQPPLSNLENPDEVDMIGIVQNVGIGYRPDLEVPAHPPSILKGRARKKRKTASGSGETEELIAPVAQIRFSHPSSPSCPTIPRAAPPAKLTSKIGRAIYPPAKPVTKKRTTSTRISPALPSLPTLESDSPTTMATDGGDESDVPIANIPRPQESSSAIPPVIAPRRVFALFKDQKLHYYPATLCPTESQTRVQVVFDDGTPCQLERQCVRSLDLRLGDTVKVDLPDLKRGTWIISNFPRAPEAAELDKHSDDSVARHSDIRGHLTISVTSKNSSISEIEVPLAKIYLTKSLWAQYGPRDTSMNFSVPISIPNSMNATASPSPFPGLAGACIRRTSTPAFMHNSPASVPAMTPKGGLFQGMVFALSFGPEDTMKRSIETKIRAHGGRLLHSGFDELFHDIDAMDDPARHPIGNGNEQQLVMKPEVQNLGFTAVIAHAHSRRAKFLQALALGLPCLAGRWIDDCVKKGKIVDWQYYLLPAGESRYLGGAVRSRMLPLSDATTTRLGDIDGRQRIFDGWNVIAVEKGLGVEKRKVFTFLCLALGAKKVVKAKTLDAGEKLLKELGAKWDCVLVCAAEKAKAKKLWKSRRGLRILDDEDVVQSLVLEKLE